MSVIIENNKSDEKNYMNMLNNDSFKRKLERTLENNFIKELKDPYFVEVVNKIDVPDNIKYRYTSELKEVAKSIPICNNCKGLSFCPFDLKGVRKCVVKDNRLIKFYYEKCP